MTRQGVMFICTRSGRGRGCEVVVLGEQCTRHPCRRRDTRRYMNGFLCPDHAPPSPPAADPSRSAVALRAARKARR